MRNREGQRSSFKPNLHSPFSDLRISRCSQNGLEQEHQPMPEMYKSIERIRITSSSANSYHLPKKRRKNESISGTKGSKIAIFDEIEAANNHIHVRFLKRDQIVASWAQILQRSRIETRWRKTHVTNSAKRKAKTNLYRDSAERGLDFQNRSVVVPPPLPIERRGKRSLDCYDYCYYSSSSSSSFARSESSFNVFIQWAFSLSSARRQLKPARGWSGGS